MQRVLQKFFTIHLLWLYVFLIICSCSQIQNQHQQNITKKDSIKSPEEYSIKLPTIILLDTCPPPQKVTLRSVPVSKPADFIASFKNYNIEDGLAFSLVACSYTDKNGVLWFGTAGGVSRYDGKSFLNYTTEQGLIWNYITGIAEDKDGTLWFGTWLGGISRYDGKTFKNYDENQGLISTKVRAVFIDRDNKLWIGTADGLSVFNGKTFTNYTIRNGLPGNNIWCITQDTKGYIWLGTFGGGISRFDGKSFTNYSVKDGLANDSVYSIVEDKNNNLWFGTGSGLSCLQYNNKTTFKNYNTKNGLTGNYIRCILQDRDQNLWFGTDNGISFFDGKSFKNYNVKQGLVNNSVKTILQDKDGNLWFGTANGISRFNGQSITAYTAEQGLIGNYVTSITQSQNNLWFLNGGGFTRYKDNLFTNYTTSQGLINTSNGILSDKNDNLWFGTENGFGSYNGKFFTYYTARQGLGDTIGINCIADDKEGDVLFGFDGGGMLILDSNRKIITKYTAPDNLPHPNIRSVFQDRNDNLWLGSWGAGVFKLKKDKKTFTVFTTEQGLADNSVKKIIEDRNGNLWFATDVGLSRYDGKSFVNYTMDDGLPNDEITALTEDKKGVIWIGSRFGISTLHFKSAQNSLEENVQFINADNSISSKDLENNYQPDFENYNYKNGFPIRSVNLNSMFVDSNNILWIGTGDKLVRFDYSAIHKNINPPEVFLQNVKINNEYISWYDIKNNNEQVDSITTPAYITEEVNVFGKQLNEQQRNLMFKKFKRINFDSISRFNYVPVNLSLPYQFNNISFDFVAAETARPNLVRYRYILKGYDKTWNPVTDKITASFGNIREGTYTFMLKAQNPDGVWGKALTYTFKVLPPWYRTWCAYALYIILLVVALWVFISYRSRALKKQNKILEDNVTNRTKQLNQSLEELKSTQAQLIQSEKMASLGELTAGIAHEIQNPLNFVNNFSELSNELIDEMKDELSKGNYEDVNAIADDVKQNLEKINHHGKRADSIVKGMLEHSRTSTGKKEPTDINKLADEYLRLSYHGFRAKDKSFNAEIKTDFDESIGKINIIPQDIGRVLLNLYNNAFYAVSKPSNSLKGEQYKPLVFVTTRKLNSPSGVGGIEIIVSDNGNGIPQNIVDKIFQPFFTTKPTGQGTGLGLSLAYDIIKAHGGEIKVETPPAGRAGKVEEGSTFIIQLPVG